MTSSYVFSRAFFHVGRSQVATGRLQSGWSLLGQRGSVTLPGLILLPVSLRERRA